MLKIRGTTDRLQRLGLKPDLVALGPDAQAVHHYDREARRAGLAVTASAVDGADCFVLPTR